MDLLGRYSVLEDQAGAPAKGEAGWWGQWRKAFNHDLRCYASLAVLPKTAFSSELAHERFARELRIAAGIRHPNLAAVFPLQALPESYLYAMEFCAGETLADHLRHSGTLDAEDALTLAQQIASGLEVANAAGLLHRNLAADNILLRQDDEERTVKILGLALPARVEMDGSPAPLPEFDFRSPEEIAGQEIDARSNIYSVGALLCFMGVGAERYAELQCRSSEPATEELSARATELSHRIRSVVAATTSRDPEKRVATFTAVLEAIERARVAPEPAELEPAFDLPVAHEAVEAPAPPPPPPAEPEIVEPAEPAQPAIVEAVEIAQPAILEMQETAPPAVVEAVEAKEPPAIQAAPELPQRRPGELIIPPAFLPIAQPGAILKLSRADGPSGPELAAFAGDSFRIGRSVDVELVTRFLPRSKENDLKTKRLSKTHVTARWHDDEIRLVDGSGVQPSANGSTFNGTALSARDPLPLTNPGELKLAQDYTIKVVPLLKGAPEEPVIFNLGEWSGPVTASATRAGALLFLPNDNQGAAATLWVFSGAAFGQGGASPLDFTAAEKTGMLRHFRGCFWLEAKSDRLLAVDDQSLEAGQIAPLTTGQVITVQGNKFTVQVQDRSKRAAA